MLESQNRFRITQRVRLHPIASTTGIQLIDSIWKCVFRFLGFSLNGKTTIRYPLLS